MIRTAFAEAVGTSPSERIRHRRLDAVRRDLCAADETGRTVSDIAMTWRFWHLGRFSHYYAAEFGESPSAALYRTRLAKI